MRVLSSYHLFQRPHCDKFFCRWSWHALQYWSTLVMLCYVSHFLERDRVHVCIRRLVHHRWKII
ncbi:hypothetical protein BDR03DRAFT_972193 [Suillus americanus]|nr:hypothetical protein BDR03DRAFT_972193 [Suillus americanus]